MRVKIIVAAVLTFACVSSSNASAATMTLETPGVVGTLDGKIGNSNETTELRDRAGNPRPGWSRCRQPRWLHQSRQLLQVFHC